MINSSAQEIGKRIKGLRQKAGINQNQLAEVIGVSNKSSVSNYERGTASPTLDQIVEMACAFHTTTDYILSGERTPCSCKIREAEEILMSMKSEKTIDAAITMLLTLERLEQS